LPLHGVILDTETTGLQYRKHEIIEIGAIAFTFSETGEIVDFLEVYAGLQQPDTARLTTALPCLKCSTGTAAVSSTDPFTNSIGQASAIESTSLRREIYRYPEADPPTKVLTAVDRFKAKRFKPIGFRERTCADGWRPCPLLIVSTCLTHR
jgi:hypothetical protein